MKIFANVIHCEKFKLTVGHLVSHRASLYFRFCWKNSWRTWYNFERFPRKIIWMSNKRCFEPIGQFSERVYQNRSNLWQSLNLRFFKQSGSQTLGVNHSLGTSGKNLLNISISEKNCNSLISNIILLILLFYLWLNAKMVKNPISNVRLLEINESYDFNNWILWCLHSKNLIYFSRIFRQWEPSTSSSFINNNFADNTINTRFFIETSEAWYPCEVYTVYDIPI